MKILIPAVVIAGLFVLQACNGDNKSTTETKMETDTTMKMENHSDAKMDGKMDMNNEMMNSMNASILASE